MLFLLFSRKLLSEFHLNFSGLYFNYNVHKTLSVGDTKLVDWRDITNARVHRNVF